MEMYKVIPTNSLVAATNNVSGQPAPTPQNSVSSVSTTCASKAAVPHNASLLQQTLHNQHVTNNTTTPKQTSNSNFVTSAKLNKSLQQTQVNANAAKATVTNQEQQAKNILCNW